MPLSLPEISRLVNIFDAHMWPQQMKYHRAKETVFELLATLLASITMEQRELIYKLLPSFRLLKLDQYPFHITLALEQIPTNLLDGRDNIYIVPIAGNLKGLNSGDVVSYLMAKTSLKEWPAAAGRNIESVLSVDKLPTPRNRSVVFIVDDFIGSSDSAETTLNAYKNKWGNNDEIIIIISILCTTIGRQRLNDLGHHIYAAEFLNKGISENPIFVTQEQRDEAIRIMTEIESILGVPHEERFGYGQVEAQVAMITTPDNTFPIYRKDNIEGERIVWLAPFVR